MCERLYSFSLIEDNTPVPANFLPIARIVFDEQCWRIDEINFIPPCLFVSSSEKLKEEYLRFFNLLKDLDTVLPGKFVTESKDALKIFWPVVQQLRIAMSKEYDMMSPMTLLGNIQKCVGAFVCACKLDEYLNLGEPEIYLNYIYAPYDFKNVYKKIREGVGLCSEIYAKIEKFNEETPKPNHTEIEAPYIEPSQLKQTIRYGSVRVKIINNTPGASVYYTIDGSTPTAASRSGCAVVIESGFKDDWHKEPPRIVTIKAIAIKDGISSKVVAYEVLIRKGNPFEGRQI